MSGGASEWRALAVQPCAILSLCSQLLFLCSVCKWRLSAGTARLSTWHCVLAPRSSTAASYGSLWALKLLPDLCKESLHLKSYSWAPLGAGQSSRRGVMVWDGHSWSEHAIPHRWQWLHVAGPFNTVPISFGHLTLKKRVCVCVCGGGDILKSNCESSPLRKNFIVNGKKCRESSAKYGKTCWAVMLHMQENILTGNKTK